MTVAQLRKALRGLKGEEPILIFDNYHFHVAAVEVCITPRGTLKGLRLIPSTQIAEERSNLENWQSPLD